MKNKQTDYTTHIPSSSELQEAMLRGRKLRAEAFMNLGGSIASTIAAPFKAIKQKRDRRRTVAALVALSDRMLADIGVERSDIWAIACQPSNNQRDRTPVTSATITPLKIDVPLTTVADTKIAA